MKLILDWMGDGYFLSTSNGKQTCDGIGGTVKQLF